MLLGKIQLNVCHSCSNIIGIILSQMIMRGRGTDVRFELKINYELIRGT